MKSETVRSVLVQGTNPEVMLQLETRQAGASHQWHYALARFNSVAVRASYQQHEVWSVPQAATPWENLKDPSKPYFVSICDRGELPC
ncbi:MAG: hypothetical protein H8E66_20270 [Planctomycetes bacterium]|nr:hypothetical protein [Planctomycetota bacterium]